MERMGRVVGGRMEIVDGKTRYLQPPSRLHGQGSDCGARGTLKAEDSLEPRGEGQLLSLILQRSVVAKTPSTASCGFPNKDLCTRTLRGDIKMRTTDIGRNRTN